MQPLRFTMAILLTCAAFAAGCGGSGDGGGGGTTAPAPAVLTTVEVTPGTASLFTASPGNTVVLTVVAKDQYGTRITNIASTSFSSQNGSVATVGNDGTVSAAGAGVAQVTASVTAGGVTRSGATTVTVRVASAAATVTAPAFSFLPDIVDISVGGNVTWTIEAIHHNVTFGSPAAPAGIDELRNASASRTFPAKGIFDYSCAFHAGMTGTVRVH